MAVGLVFYCFITNYHVISCLKKHPCIILPSNRGLPGFSAQGLTRLQSRYVFSSEAQWGQCQRWGEEGKIHLAPSGSRNNSFAYGCSTKGHIFLLLLGKEVCPEFLQSPYSYLLHAPLRPWQPVSSKPM